MTVKKKGMQKNKIYPNREYMLLRGGKGKAKHAQVCVTKYVRWEVTESRDEPQEFWPQKPISEFSAQPINLFIYSVWAILSLSDYNIM